MSTNTFPAAHRIKKRRDFLRAERGIKLHSAHFLVWVMRREEQGCARLGITTSRKVGNAVIRNRIRRLIREYFRHQVWPGVDLVVVAKRNPTLLHAEVHAELDSLRRKIIERFSSQRRTEIEPT